MNKELKHIDGGSGRTMGLMNVSYQQIIASCGEPNIQDDPDKVDASWGVEHTDGRQLFIWNYKNGEAYLGAEGKNWKNEITNWSMDGSQSLAEELFGEMQVSS